MYPHGNYQIGGYQNSGYQNNGYQIPSNQSSIYQIPNYQIPNYQSNGYQSNGYQSNGEYQNGGYQSERQAYCEKCLLTHDEVYGNNYVWLDVLGHGRVVRVWFKEPVDSKEFVLYNTKWWETHCRVVDHGSNLYDSHVRAFVDPKTRFARMLFLFEDGSLIEANEEFYRLEQEYFNSQKLCRK